MRAIAGYERGEIHVAARDPPAPLGARGERSGRRRQGAAAARSDCCHDSVALYCFLYLSLLRCSVSISRMSFDLSVSASCVATRSRHILPRPAGSSEAAWSVPG